MGNTYGDIDLIQLYRDSKPKHLLICSYTLDLSLLERKLLFYLRKEIDTRVAIVTSRLGYEESFQEGSAVGGAGKDYYLYRIDDSPYAFHPKIYLYVDQNDRINIYVSGANFTYPGLCHNFDCVESILFDKLNNDSINNLDSFLKSLELDINDYQFSRFLEPIRFSLSKQTAFTSNKTFITNVANSILDESLTIIDKPIKHLKIISPYYDEDFYALESIRKKLGYPKTDVLCNAQDIAFNINKLPKSVKLFITSHSRYLHTKLYLLYTDTGIISISGSANCTRPGLLSNNKDGNWEAVVLDTELPIDQAEFLWKFYDPKPIKKNDYWTYKKPPKNSTDNHHLIFEATLNFNHLKINPKSGFPNFSSIIECTIETQNRDFIEREINSDGKDDEFTFELTATELNTLDNCAAKVELQISSEYSGSAWITQPHLIRKSNKLKRLENTIESLRKDSADGWDGLLSLIEFISENLPLLSSKRLQVSGNGAKNLTGQHKQSRVLTIKGIYDIDDQFIFKDWNPKLGDFFDLGNTFRHLFEKGLDIYSEEEEDDDNDEFETSERSRTDKSNKKDSTSYQLPIQKDAEADYIKRINIIDKIPHLNSIFKESIITPMDDFFNENKHDIEETNYRYEALLDTILFCLKLIRFIRLELILSVKTTQRNLVIETFLDESGFLLRWFWSTTLKLINGKILDLEQLKNYLQNSEFVPENLMLLAEFWTLNYESRIGNDLIYKVVELLSKISNDSLDKILMTYYDNSSRLNSDKKNNFYIKSYSNLFNDILFIKDKLNNEGALLSKYIKYQYWDEAYKYHTDAFDILTENKSNNNVLIEKHRNRKKIAENILDLLWKDAEKELGSFYDTRLFDFKRFYGISEIKNNYDMFYCPSCGYTLSTDTFLKLKQFEFVTCPDCESLFIPIERAKIYNSLESDDSEWEGYE